ncbi:MAG: cytochrome c3 family protein [Planctomycetota bacterium]
MKLPRPNLLLSAAALGAVLVLAGVDLRRTSPGPISRVHAQAAVLAADDGCAECHGRRAESMAAACAECHEEVTADIAAKRGLHGTLAGVAPEECATCHSEHRGEDFALAGARSFALAGIADPARFDHRSLDFDLGGRHLELACAECHPNAEAALLPPDARRFGGLLQACDSCHEDVHAGRIVRECADCHGQEHPFAEVAVFRHGRSFRAEGAHLEPGCRECHARDGAYAVEVLAGAGSPPADRACRDCHPSPHDPGFLRRLAGARGEREAASCASCHDAVHRSFAGHDSAMDPAAHPATGFPLDPPHDRATCADCHPLPPEGSEGRFAARFPGRAAEDCRACHADPHGGQFDAGPFAAEDCLGCHAPHSFLPPAFDAARHARTAFPLEGSHLAVGCDRCHERPAEDSAAPRRFRGTPGTCAACHADAHRGLLAGGTAEGCAECHVATSFAAVDVAGFDHGARAGFVLDGAHATAKCEACHPRAATADAEGRRFGRVAALFPGPPERCETCHADAHHGVLAGADAPVEVDGREGCVRCHDRESFAAVDREGFDHALWTGYPLAGVHAAVDCALCHPPLPRPGARRRTTMMAAGRACADCHVDPHAGQFARDGGTECARCHVLDGGLSFDHQTDSRFPLDETHREIACAKCHVPWPLPGGSRAIRYRPLGLSCTDCHGVAGDRDQEGGQR